VHARTPQKLANLSKQKQQHHAMAEELQAKQDALPLGRRYKHNNEMVTDERSNVLVHRGKGALQA
jgi:hypothetical protein